MFSEVSHLRRAVSRPAFVPRPKREIKTATSHKPLEESETNAGHAPRIPRDGTGAVIGGDGQERTHVRPEASRCLVTTVGEVQVPRVAYSGRGLGAHGP